MHSCKPQFYYIKMEFKGGQNYTCLFRDVVDVRDQFKLNIYSVDKIYYQNIYFLFTF